MMKLDPDPSYAERVRRLVRDMSDPILRKNWSHAKRLPEFDNPEWYDALQSEMEERHLA